MAQELKIVFTAVEQAELVAYERDEQPLGPLEVAGHTLVSLVSAGTEMNFYRGNYQEQGLSWGVLPVTPGYAAVFRAEEVGSEVAGIRPDDRVYCTGPHRSYQRVQRHRAIPLPEDLSAEVALFARMVNVTMCALTTTTARPPAKVVVTGLGVVGLLGAQVFQQCGYEVIACEPLESRRRIARQCGIRNVLPKVPVGDSDVVGQVSLVLECSAHEQAIMDGCAVVRKGGEVVLVGVPAMRRTDLYAQEAFNRVFRNYVTLRSGKEDQIPAQPTDFRHNSTWGNTVVGLRWLAEGRIRVDGLYTQASPRDPQRIYQDVLHQRIERLSVMLNWTDLP